MRWAGSRAQHCGSAPTHFGDFPGVFGEQLQHKLGLPVVQGKSSFLALNHEFLALSHENSAMNHECLAQIVRGSRPKNRGSEIRGSGPKLVVQGKALRFVSGFQGLGCRVSRPQSLGLGFRVSGPQGLGLWFWGFRASMGLRVSGFKAWNLVFEGLQALGFEGLERLT